jgi:hypothetical protein
MSRLSMRKATGNDATPDFKLGDTRPGTAPGLRETLQPGHPCRLLFGLQAIQVLLSAQEHLSADDRR